MSSIDLNADIGEGAGTDRELLDIVSSASIACGGHAGDEATMRAVLGHARTRGVTCGAHPGFADREHFGRRRLALSNKALHALVVEQLERLFEVAAAESVSIRYVKLHGALANMASINVELAETAFTAVRQVDPSLAILALDNSAQVTAADNLGLRVIREAYADRAYTPHGQLVPRSEAGALMTDAGDVVEHCKRIAKGEIIAIDGTRIATAAQSICVHGDTPGAVALARRVRDALLMSKIAIRATV